MYSCLPGKTLRRWRGEDWCGRQAASFRTARVRALAGWMPPSLELRDEDADEDMPGSRTSLRKSVSFSTLAVTINTPPNPNASSFFARYLTRDRTAAVHRYMLGYGCWYGPTADAYGRVSQWAGNGYDASIFFTCSPCCGWCFVQTQRQAIERKLARWHKERGDPRAASLVPNGLIHCCLSACCTSRLVAENVAVLANFKAHQNLSGWPAGTDALSDTRAMPSSASPPVQEMQRADEGEIAPLV